MILSNKSSANRIPDKSTSSTKKRGRPAGVENKNSSSTGGTTITSPPPDTSILPPIVVPPVEKQPGDVSFPLINELVFNHYKIRR